MLDLKQIPAFELEQTENLTDITSTGYLFRHKKSGARIAVISNDDDNKVFSIAFRTTPVDNTGVFHIIEHTTLCGSEKYPLKDPFIDLAKGSLNTFLNAITFPDRTAYPIASYNDQDFKNLMDVYLDAVFSPLLLKEDKIFKQEGWHYEMDDADSDLIMNGVVYNEMKGAYSSEDSILHHKIMASLFPDNTYGKDSGGNPDAILDLTYDGYVETYHKYYHPSNSFIYLYGDLDIVERLNYLDQEYLSKFDTLEMDTEVKLQKPFEKRGYFEEDYPVASDADTENSTYLSLNFVVGDALDKKTAMAMDILDYALISAPGAPVTQALLDAGIGADVYSEYNNSMRQCSFAIIAKGANAKDRDRFVEIIETTLRQQIEKGLDKESLLASINSNEFQYREADYGMFPKGLMYMLKVYDGWNYDDQAPYLYVQLLDTYAKLKKDISTGYFEKLIQTKFLDNPHSTVLVLKPNQGMVGRAEDALKEALQKKKDSLSKEEIDAIVRETKELHQYQETPDDEETKKCIPMLTRADLKKESLEFSNIELTEDGIPYVRHDYETHGIDYLSMIFDIDDLEPERVSLMSLYSLLLSFINTKNYDYLGLSNAINIYTGGINFSPSVLCDLATNEVKKRFIVKVRSLEENFGRALELVDEVLFESDFTDVKRITEVVKQIRSRLQADLSASGNATATTRAMSNFSQMIRCNEALHGVEFYQYISEVEKTLETNPDAIVEDLKKIHQDILSRKRLMVSFTSNEQVFQNALPIMKEHFAKLPEAFNQMKGGEFVLESKKEGLTDASQIQYVCRAGNFKKHGFEYSGYLRMLKMILGYDYLWTNVRVKGGAYGCTGNFSRSGESYIVSYRDPNLSKTNEIYEKIPEYIANFDADERTMTGYVISTFGVLDTPLNPSAKGSRSMNAYLTNLTYDVIQKERMEVLNATPEDIRALAPLLKAVLDDGYFCVVGNEKKINEEHAFFDEISKLCE